MEKNYTSYCGLDCNKCSYKVSYGCGGCIATEGTPFWANWDSVKCDFCFMGQWCGSCRSDYNCCSFAVLFEDKKCPNVSCADEKGLDGCYDCLELENCTVGYYGNENEYAAKATAIYIKKYGKEKYTEILKKAIEGGMEYAKDLDECGSVEKAVELLEKWG